MSEELSKPAIWEHWAKAAAWFVAGVAVVSFSHSEYFLQHFANGPELMRGPLVWTTQKLMPTLIAANFILRCACGIKAVRRRNAPTAG